ncbi:hypothetical protein Tco_0645841 [Tanacetum coccineum]
MMVQAQEEGEGSEMPTVPQHTSTINQPSSSQPLKKQKPRKTKKQNTEVSQPSDPTEPMTDETENVESVPTHSNDLLLSEITKLKKRVKKLERRNKSRTPGLKRRMHPNRGGKLLILMLMQRIYHSTAEPSTPPTTSILIEYEDLTIAQTLMKMRSMKSKEKLKEKGVSSETATTTTTTTRGVTMQEPTMMEADYELAQRLQAEEQSELTIKERSELFVELMDKRKKHFAKLRAEVIRRKPLTKAQKRNQMCTYLKNMANYKHKGSKKSTRKELDEESVKRQKLEDDAKKAKLKACLEIVPDNDSAVNVESLATKYPIVEWKTHILAEDKILSDLSSHSTRSKEMFEYILLMKIKHLIKKLEDSEVMIVTTAGEVQRKYSKSLLLLVVKLLLLVLVTTARRVSAIRV